MTKHTVPDIPTATPLPPTPWRAIQGPGQAAWVVDADEQLVALVPHNVGPPGTALRCAHQLAAAPQLAHVLGGLMRAVHDSEFGAVEDWLAQADALLERLSEATTEVSR